MRLYRGKIPAISDDVFDAMVDSGCLEVSSENVDEVKLDIKAVLKEYHRIDNEIGEEAHEIQRETDKSFGRAKHELADQKGIGIGEDAVGYIIDQLIETFFHSNFVDEIYAPDNKIRSELAPILRDHMSVQEKVEEEAREKIKHVEEGTKEWEVEYQKVMERLKRTKNLE